MPIYEYELLDGECQVCGGAFELHRPIDWTPITKCPLCKKAVRKVVSKVNTPKLTKPLSVSDAKKAGFTVLERRDGDTFEKL